MGLIRPRSLAAILAAALAAGCGTVTTASTAVRPAPAKGAALAAQSPAGATPRQRAAAEARRMLGQFTPPPGADRLPGPPRLPSGSATMGITAATQAGAVGYWRAAGTPVALRSWEKAHMPRSFSRQDVIIGPPSWDTVYSLPPVAGVLPQRELNVQFYDVGGAAVVIMADAMVAWQPPRPAAEVIPATARAVSIASSGGIQGDPAPVTITAAPVIRRLAALLNGLPVATTATGIPCSSQGSDLRLTFRAVAGGPELAFVDGGGCGTLSVRVNGRDQPNLQPASRSYDATILKIAGLPWKPVT